MVGGSVKHSLEGWIAENEWGARRNEQGERKLGGGVVMREQWWKGWAEKGRSYG